MAGELPPLLANLFALLTTYLLHSTCLLVGTWLLLACYRSAGPALRSKLWKLAAVGGLITAPAASLLAPLSPFGTLALWDNATTGTTEATHRRPALHPLPRDASEHPSVLPSSIPESAAADDTQTFSWHKVPDNQAPLGTIKQQRPHESPSTVIFEQEVALDDEHVTAAQFTPLWSPPSILEASRFSASTGSLISLGYGIAAACVLCGTLRLCWQTWWLRRRFLKCTAIHHGHAQRELAQLCSQAGISRQILLLSSADYPEPIAVGVWRWRIILPSHTEDELSVPELRALLAHELAHLVRRDIWWLWLGRVLCSCLAFQPLNFLARRRWQQAAELLCDNWAVSSTGDHLALARCLTTVAGWRLNDGPPAVSLAASGMQSTLAHRIERLVENTRLKDPWTTLPRRRLFAAISIGVVTLLTCLGPKAIVTAQSEQPTEPTQHGKPAAQASPTTELALPEQQPLQQPAEQHNELPKSPHDDLLDADLHALQLELDRLESELNDLDQLVRESTPDPQALQLWSRLQARLRDIRQGRQTLTRLLEKCRNSAQEQTASPNH